MLDKEKKSLKSLALTGSAWTVGGYGARQLLRFISNVILARLLFPEAFGIMALVNVFIQGLEMFSDIGIKPSIIYDKRGDEIQFLNTAWTVQVIRGVILFFIACISAYPFSLIYTQPILALIIPVAGFNALTSGFSSTAIATANRHIKLGRLTLLELYGQISSMVIMISIALLYKTVWALVAGGLISAIVKCILSHLWLADIRNRFYWDRPSARSLIRFGKWIFVSTLLTFCVLQADRLIFGKLVPIGVLGVYSIALALASIPREVIMRLSSMIVFPLFSRTYRDTGSLKKVFYSTRYTMVVIGSTVSVFMFLVAPVLIDVLYDDRYIEAGWILQVLSIGVFLHVLECTNGEALLSIGKPKLVAFGNGMKLLGMILLIPTCYSRWGFHGAVVGYALSEAFRYIFSVLAIRFHGLSVIASDIKLIAFWVVTICLGTFGLRADIFNYMAEVAKIPLLGFFVATLWSPLLLRSISILKD